MLQILCTKSLGSAHSTACMGWGAENNPCSHQYKSVDPKEGVACLLPLLSITTLSLSSVTLSLTLLPLNQCHF